MTEKKDRHSHDFHDSNLQLSSRSTGGVGVSWKPKGYAGTIHRRENEFWETPRTSLRDYPYRFTTPEAAAWSLIFTKWFGRRGTET
jgi:hypothetical protein